MTQVLTERVQLLMEPAQLFAVDDWRFANRVRSRGEAIRRLVELGLTARPVSLRPPQDVADHFGSATTQADPSVISKN